jgi:hypothetical protein
MVNSDVCVEPIDSSVYGKLMSNPENKSYAEELAAEPIGKTFNHTDQASSPKQSSTANGFLVQEVSKSVMLGHYSSSFFTSEYHHPGW